MIRKPIVSGSFYPSEEKELAEKVQGFLINEKKENVFGAIVPHAGYDFSGKTAGKIYSLIPEKKDFIILGVNHSGIGKKISMSLEDFKTPLGIAKNNKGLGEEIFNKLKHSELEVEFDENAHEQEHSIEVQIPFLQNSQDRFKIVPILLKDLKYEECKKIAEIIEEFIDENVCLIVSSDFTHYGKSYGFVKDGDAKQNIEKIDDMLIFEILKKSSKSFFTRALKSTVCGVYALTIITEIAKIKNWKVEKIEYTNSGEVTGNWENVVGYAGIVFEL
ncbi:MAG: AmmeMemoRadiSam system protein B [Nanoarchaeota archaeon]|nr:AmmeMemoRadiSam system protein B [Nanoarchaeota archaeon]